MENKHEKAPVLQNLNMEVKNDYCEETQAQIKPCPHSLYIPT